MYASNRGLDCIAVFALTADGGVDVSVPTIFAPTGGQTPRGFCLSADGALLAVVHQHSRSLALFDVDTTTGTLTSWGPATPLPHHAPVCVRFV